MLTGRMQIAPYLVEFRIGVGGLQAAIREQSVYTFAGYTGQLAAALTNFL